MDKVRNTATPVRLRAGLLAALGLSIAACIFFSRGWGIGQDSRLMHCVVFLMHHGFAPYRDIVDMNMPVTYMVEWAGMAVFGWSDPAWRCFDLFLLLLGCVAAADLARPRGRFAAGYAALLLALAHFSGGAFDAAQRDYTLAVLLLLGTAAMFFAMRRVAAWPMFFFGAAFGFAAGIKPYVLPLPFLLLAAAVLRLHRRNVSPGKFVAWALAGAVIPIAAVCAFLQHYHAWQAFLGPALELARYHRGNGNLPWTALLLRWLPWMLMPLFTLAAVKGVAAWRQDSWDWEECVLLAIGLFGLASYLYQGKGWSYQAAPALMFLAVLAARLLAGVRTHSALGRYAFAALLAFSVLLPAGYIPLNMARHPHRDPDVVESSLMADLAAAAVQPGDSMAKLSGHIECLDWNSGCLGALYRLRLVPVTGDVFDFWLLPSRPAPVTRELQANFYRKITASPPRVIVLTAHDWPAQQGFAKLDRWPQFATWLNTNYSVALEHHAWMTENHRPVDRGYRIYVRK